MPENIYKAPEAELAQTQESLEANEFFVVSIQKLWVMNIVTMGVYALYWYYKHWQLFRVKNNDYGIWPVARAIFAIFFIMGLFDLINDDYKKKSDKPWNYKLSAITYILVVLLSSFVSIGSGIAPFESDEVQALFELGNIVVVVVLTTWVLASAQVKVNLVCSDPKGKSNKRFTWGNIVLMCVFSLYWIVVLYGTYLIQSDV